MTPADIAEGRRLVAAATPGPWEEEHTTTANDHYACGSGPWHLAPAEDPRVGADAALIVYLRNHAAELLDAAERAERAERERDEADDCLRDAMSKLDAWEPVMRAARTDVEMGICSIELQAAVLAAMAQPEALDTPVDASGDMLGPASLLQPIDADGGTDEP